MPQMVVAQRFRSQHRVEPLALHQVEKLQERAARLLVADLPLLDGGQTGIEHSGEGYSNFALTVDSIWRALAEPLHIDVVAGNLGIVGHKGQRLGLGLGLGLAWRGEYDRMGRRAGGGGDAPGRRAGY